MAVAMPLLVVSLGGVQACLHSSTSSMLFYFTTSSVLGSVSPLQSISPKTRVQVHVPSAVIYFLNGHVHKY